jgi:hypothetical protein
VLPERILLAVVGESQSITFEVAQNCPLLISPSPSELSATHPLPSGNQG